MSTKTQNNYKLWRVSYDLDVSSYSGRTKNIIGEMYIVAENCDEAIEKAKRTREAREHDLDEIDLEAKIFSPKLRLPQDKKKFSLELILKEKI